MSVNFAPVHAEEGKLKMGSHLLHLTGKRAKIAEERHGKQLAILGSPSASFDRTAALCVCVHLGMTGSLVHRSPDRSRAMRSPPQIDGRKPTPLQPRL